KKFGWYVYVADESVIGYAYASPHRDRAAYQWSCEVSVYIAQNSQGRGSASSLYRRLFCELKRKGFVTAYAGITLPNPHSVAFHQALGFRQIGTYEKIGYKLGQWHDVSWWELKLLKHPKNP